MFVLMIDQVESNGDPVILESDILNASLSNVKAQAQIHGDLGHSTAIFELRPIDAGSVVSARIMLEQRILQYTTMSEDLGKAKV